MAHIKNIASDTEYNYILMLCRPGMIERYYNPNQDTWDLEHKTETHDLNGKEALEAFVGIDDFCLESYGVITRAKPSNIVGPPRALLLKRNAERGQPHEVLKERILITGPNDTAYFALEGVEVPGMASVTHMLTVILGDKIRYLALDTEDNRWTENSFTAKTFKDEDEALKTIKAILAGTDQYSQDCLRDAFPLQEEDFEGEKVKPKAFFTILTYASRHVSVFPITFNVNAEA